MASFDRNGNTPHFDIEELKQIYDAVKVKDTPSLRAKAKELFPGCDPICYENIHLWEGPGRAFIHNSDDYVKPKHVITAYPLLIGIMDDGTFYPF